MAHKSESKTASPIPITAKIKKGCLYVRFHLILCTNKNKY